MSKERAKEQTFAEKIREQREEWGLEIEEAAMDADVEPEVWETYEKEGTVLTPEDCDAICRAMHWLYLSPDGRKPTGWFDVEAQRQKKSWSKDIEGRFGQPEALSFAIGFSMLWDRLIRCIDVLSTKPKGTHVGEIEGADLAAYLPEQFLMRYDYEFLISMRKAAERIYRAIQLDEDIYAHTVMEELVVVVSVNLSLDLIYGAGIPVREDFDEWFFDLLGDMDIEMYLFDVSFPAYVDVNDTKHPYHFNNWQVEQFYEGFEQNE